MNMKGSILGVGLIWKLNKKREIVVVWTIVFTAWEMNSLLVGSNVAFF
jgi:hypothetical protein